jgi:hypothetical protein
MMLAVVEKNGEKTLAWWPGMRQGLTLLKSRVKLTYRVWASGWWFGSGLMVGEREREIEWR